MARSKKVTTTEIIDTPEEPTFQEQPLDAESPDESEALSRILERFGPAEVKFKVYRKTDKGDAFCFTAMEDLDEAFIQETYGGGLYVVRIYVSGKYVKPVELLIAEKKISGIGGGNQEYQSRLDPAGNVEARLLREQLSFMQNMLLQRGGSGGPMLEIVEAVKAMHAMAPQPVQQEDSFDKFARMLEVAKGLLGAGGDTDWKTEMVRTAKDVAAPILREMASRQMGAAATQPASVPAQQVIEGQQSMITPDIMIRQGIDFLKSKAMSNSDPNLVVDWIVDNAADPMYQGFIANILSQPFESMQKLDPSLGQPPYEKWFRSLYDGLKEAFNNEPTSTMESDSQRSGGNVTDIKNNAGVGKGNGSKARVS